MKDLLSYIFCMLAQGERARIDEADANPDKWYELFIINEDGSTKTVETGNTFTEVTETVKKYVAKYKFDCISINILESKKFPKSIYRLFSTPQLYSIIRDYFRSQNKLEDMRFVGELSFQEDKPVPKKECYAEETEIFIDEIAFTYFQHLVCYISESGEEDNLESGYTYNDFLEIAEGNTDLARHLFDEVTWEHPSTLFMVWESCGTLDELEKMYEEKKTVYSYTDSGDFVYCNNCEKTMLVPTGADKCPACYCEGMLRWVDEEHQEVNHSELNDLDGYKDFKIVVKNEPEPAEYLTDETLIEEFEMTPDSRHESLRTIICNGKAKIMTVDALIEVNRNCETCELEQYKKERRKIFCQFTTAEEFLEDFDSWKEQQDLEIEKVLDSNYWSSI